MRRTDVAQPGLRGDRAAYALAPLACLAAGAGAVLAFAPERLASLAFVSVAVLLWATDFPERHRRAFLNAFLFGIGFYLAGIGWIYISLNRYGGMSPPLAGFATLLVSLWMAGWLALCAVAARVATRRLGGRFVRLAALAAVWSLLETQVRAEFPLGFPWLALGQSQVPDGALAGLVPLFGAHGVSVLAAIVSACTVCVVGSVLDRRGSRQAAFRHMFPAWLVPAAVAVALFAGAAVAKQAEYTRPAGAPISVSLLQGNIPQNHKWVAENRAAILSAYDHLAELAEGRLVIMPETALPLVWQDVPEDVAARYRARAAAREGAVIVGVFELSADLRGLHNSAVALGKFADMHYRKSELAPFGEFIPFSPLFTWAAELLDIPHSELTPGEEKGGTLMALPFVKVLVGICYEDAFPLAFAGKAAEAAFLANMTNGAWFEDSRMLDQHLQISQARALETGREMVRATNTGVTAHISHLGQTIAMLEPHQAGVLEAQVTPRAGETPYVRSGGLLLALALAAIFAVAWVSGRK